MAKLNLHLIEIEPLTNINKIFFIFLLDKPKNRCIFAANNSKGKFS